MRRDRTVRLVVVSSRESRSLRHSLHEHSYVYQGQPLRASSSLCGLRGRREDGHGSTGRSTYKDTEGEDVTGESQWRGGVRVSG